MGEAHPALSDGGSRGLEDPRDAFGPLVLWVKQNPAWDRTENRDSYYF